MGAGSEKKYDEFKFDFKQSYDMPNFEQVRDILRSGRTATFLISLGCIILLACVIEIHTPNSKMPNPLVLIYIIITPFMSAMFLFSYLEKKIKTMFHLTDEDIERHAIEECKRWENELRENFEKYCRINNLEAVFIKDGTFEDGPVKIAVGGFSTHDDLSKKQEISKVFLFNKADFVKSAQNRFK
jgi:hypothetical protein